MSKARHTKGPWRWEVSESARQIHLVGGVPEYDLTVLDFVRWGTQSAQPRLREDVDQLNIMHNATKWAIPVHGREHHADWFKALNHPDAHLIAAAPDLYTSLKDAVAILKDMGAVGTMLGRFEKAIAKAEGKA